MARRPLGLGNARGHRISEGRSVAVRHARSGSRPLARRHVLPRIRCEDRGGSLPRSWCAADLETASEMRFATGKCALLLHELGIADGRTNALVERLLHWQWPDGGWNCDKHSSADTS